MFDLLIAARVAYFREHPEDPALYHGQSRGMNLELTRRITAWLTTSPAWTRPAIAQRLNEELSQLLRATEEEMDYYLKATNHAIAQLEYGEHH